MGWDFLHCWQTITGEDNSRYWTSFTSWQNCLLEVTTHLWCPNSAYSAPMAIRQDCVQQFIHSFWEVGTTSYQQIFLPLSRLYNVLTAQSPNYVTVFYRQLIAFSQVLVSTRLTLELLFALLSTISTINHSWKLHSTLIIRPCQLDLYHSSYIYPNLILLPTIDITHSGNIY